MEGNELVYGLLVAEAYVAITLAACVAQNGYSTLNVNGCVALDKLLEALIAVGTVGGCHVSDVALLSA